VPAAAGSPRTGRPRTRLASTRLASTVPAAASRAASGGPGVAASTAPRGLLPAVARGPAGWPTALRSRVAAPLLLAIPVAAATVAAAPGEVVRHPLRLVPASWSCIAARLPRVIGLLAVALSCWSLASFPIALPARVTVTAPAAPVAVGVVVSSPPPSGPVRPVHVVATHTSSLWL